MLGLVYERLKNWRGFIFGTAAGLFVGNLVAAAGVVLLGMFFLPTSAANPFPGMAGGLAGGIGIGLLLFWFGTMFPFVIILDPPIVRLLRPYASNLSVGRAYPDLSEPNKRVLWSWSILVSILVLGALAVALFSGVPGIKSIVSGDGGVLNWELLFIISAVAGTGCRGALASDYFADSQSAEPRGKTLSFGNVKIVQPYDVTRNIRPVGRF